MTPIEKADATRPALVEGGERVRVVAAQIEVVAGSDAGLTLPLGPSRALVGTGPACDLRLSDPLVSRRHLEFQADAEGIRVTDQESLNGTYCSGLRIADVVVTDNALFTLGDTTLAVRVQSEPLDVVVSSHTSFGDAIGHSAAMRHVFALLERAAQTDVTVLLEGDSGTGKDVIARALHAQSKRRDAPFVVVDCGAVSDNLLESELFGHERGAFTSAVSSRMGAFELANGGSLFLDEVGELSLQAQPKLLRVLESRAFRRIGGTQELNVDVRVIAATNRRLREAVRRGEFREDLFYRLAVAHVTVPRLGDRKQDIPALAETFLRKATGDPGAEVPSELLRLLVAYDWPGNARELRNVIDRFATFGHGDPKILFGHAIHGEPSSPTEAIDLDAIDGLPYHEAKRRVIGELQRQLLPRVLERAGGSVARAAAMLGLTRTSLYKMLQQLR